MPFSPNVSDQSANFMFEGISNIGKDFSEALKKYENDRKQKQFNEGIFDSLKSAGEVSPEALQKWSTWNTDKQGGYLAGQMRTVTEKRAVQKAQDDHAMAVAHANYFNTQANAKADPQSLELTPEEQDAAMKSGKVPLRTSKGSFQYADLPEKDQPVTDEQGNTQFTPDGTQYKTAKGWKPVTGPMLQAHIVAGAQKQMDAAKAQADEIAKNPPKSGVSVMDPRTWFGSKAPAPTLKQTPVKVASPEEAKKLPKGTPIILPDGSLGTVP